MLTTVTRDDDLDDGMDLPVTEDSVYALVTRMLQEDTRRLVIGRGSGPHVITGEYLNT